MDFTLYLNKFQLVADRLDKGMLAKKQMEVAVGKYRESVFLKLFKKKWTNEYQDPLTAESRIFFSVWVDDAMIKEQKFFYNIHALKLRQLSGYSITSRDFASDFRKKFESFEQQWPNVSTKFGPLTLMQGWVKPGTKRWEEEILELANRFLDIDYLIDETLALFKK